MSFSSSELSVTGGRSTNICFFFLSTKLHHVWSTCEYNVRDRDREREGEN